MNKYLTIVAGDPNSIGFEILGKALRKLSTKSKKKILLVGSYELLKNQLQKLKIKIPLYKITSFDEIIVTNKLIVLDVPIKFKNAFNVKEKYIKKYILKCIDIAHELSMKDKIIGFVNLPINKKIVFKNQKIGMTEYLAKKCKTNKSEVMMIYNDNFSVVPITTHINIKDVSKSLTSSLIEKKIITTNNFLKKIYRRKPIMAIFGLNPHNDELRNKSEEKKVILPALKKLKKKNIKAFGPYPADTIFINKDKYKYDVIVGMYHDQVLAPFKSIYQFDAINITLGLKYLRISPDHGTGYDIAGQGKANPLSLIKAINFFKKFG